MVHFWNRITFFNKCFQRQFSNMTACWNECEYSMISFDPPDWALDLPNTPKQRFKLAQLPTPIHRWEIPGKLDDFRVFIKRDDLTGCTLSGNKVRKLEFLLADAVSSGCSHVITCGGVQSNHCRATAAAAAQLGLKCHLVLRCTEDNISESEIQDIDCAGNLFLDQMFGAEIYCVGRRSAYETQLKPRMQQIADRIKSEKNELSYLIPVGGSDSVGLWGYIEGYRELLVQGLVSNITDIVFACGSGGTAEGLAIANYLSGNQHNIRIHGIAVSDDAEYFHAHTAAILKQLNLDHKIKSEDILHIIEGYKGQGYGIAQKEDLEFIRHVSQTSGIVLDPTYTGKAAKGLLKEMRNKSHDFLGNNILFIHTGGVFGAMDGRLASLLQNTQKMHLWAELNKPPWQEMK